MDSNSIHDLIVKILSNTADDQEHKDFHQWLQQSEENQQLYRQYNILWKQMDHSYDQLSFNKTIAREKIREKTLFRQLRARKIRILSRISAAASVLILIGAGYLVRHQPIHTEAKILTYTTRENRVREIILPDSSHVWLNENSSLHLARSFDRLQRKVVLEGEAYFEVKKDNRHPFKVETGKTITKVLGTSFTLKLMEHEQVNLTVNTGRVQFFKKNSLQNKAIFTAGQMGVLDAQNDKLVKTLNHDPNYLSWKTGVLTFSNTPLSDVCRTLSKHFAVPVECRAVDPNLSLTGTFTQETLEDILSTIELTLDIRTRQVEGVVSLYN